MKFFFFIGLPLSLGALFGIFYLINLGMDKSLELGGLEAEVIVSVVAVAILFIYILTIRNT